MKEPRPWPEMNLAALEVKNQIADACSRIEIAGSIRRNAPMCSDIELVVVPRFETIPVGLFGEPHESNLLDSLVDGWLNNQRESGYAPRLDKKGHKAIGSKYKRLSFQGVALDLFAVVSPAQWGVIYTIRTGPSLFSHRLVSHPTIDFPDGSRGTLPHSMRIQDGALWDNGTMIETLEERDFFAAIGKAWVEPEDRR